MSDFINKVISLIIVFVMLIMAPMLISYKTDQMISERAILNDVQLFVDSVKDSGNITEDSLNKLYLDCNSHGLTVNVTVKRLVRYAVWDPVNKVSQTSYYAVDELKDLQNMNVNDIVQVHIEEQTISSARKLTYKLLKVDEGPFEITLAGMVEGIHYATGD